jgi:uncharacterized protein with HEPN domain
MTRRDVRFYLADLIQAYEDIEDTVANVSESAFMADRLRQKAVIRDLEVIGEACRHIPDELRRMADGVPWERIVAMRNRLIHEYFGVDVGVVYATAVDRVPELLAELRRLAATLDDPPST